MWAIRPSELHIRKLEISILKFMHGSWSYVFCVSCLEIPRFFLKLHYFRSFRASNHYDKLWIIVKRLWCYWYDTSYNMSSLLSTWILLFQLRYLLSRPNFMFVLDLIMLIAATFEMFCSCIIQYPNPTTYEHDIISAPETCLHLWQTSI